VTRVDKAQNLIIYQKAQDLKGKHPQDVIKHNIGRGGLRPGEWQEIMNWAEVGKQAVFFHNGSASETFIGSTWYQAYPQGEWWGMSHGEPFLLRSYAGRVDRLPGIMSEIMAGREVIVPCMVDGDKEALHKKTARVQRLKASLKLNDYNPKRDFAGWGGEDIRRLAGMPGFDRYAGLAKLDAEAQAVSVVDFDNDGKQDLLLLGAGKVALLQNGGDSYSEVTLPGLTGGARSAVWADHNADGLPDLLLATADGPRLFTNLGKGQFRDDSSRLPREPGYDLTAAAWGDFDGDGKADVLLANGYHGLRLYRNSRPEVAKRPPPPKMGDWHVIGMFRAANPADNPKTAFPVETEAFNAGKEYKGKRDLPVKWAKKEFKDGESHQFADLGANQATYLFRELDAAVAADVGVSLTSPGTLTVWVNGERAFHSEERKTEPHAVTLKLRPGKNTLLVKVCVAEQVAGLAFALGDGGAGTAGPWFADVSAAWGLGPTGLAADLRGDTLAVADFDGNGRPDVLYGAGTGVLLRNTGTRFELKAGSGIDYRPGRIGPALADFNGDGLLDLFIPQADGRCKLFRNAGNGTFADVTATTGDLARPIPGAVTAAWGDFDNDGHPDLFVGCLRGVNHYFKNNGNGTFTDRTAELGLTTRVFNTQAAAFADLNGDGQLDLILANEGQESAILFGVKAAESPRTPVVVALNGTPGLNGGRVVVKDAAGRAVASAAVTGGDGRGGNTLAPRFVLAPGAYRVEIVAPGGRVAATPLEVQTSPMTVRVQQ
ncbi:MAG TPA: VCBS repeat-containing protein, partial [Urbifossiella sp.]|nr:VCBS repeat-containing protein [Urbifossiella sp.]